MTPYEILQQHPVRFTPKQKKAFLNEVMDYAHSIGYSYLVDSGDLGKCNLIIGDPEHAQCLITAPYATAMRWPFAKIIWQNSTAVLTLLEMMKSVVVQHRNKLCFVLFDITRSHMSASKSYAKRYRSSVARQLVWQLDGVGERDHILFMPNKNVMLCECYMHRLHKCCTTLGVKTLGVGNKFFRMSGNYCFLNCIQVSAFSKLPKGKYFYWIPVDKSLSIEMTNVNILRSTILSAIICAAD